MTSPPTHGFTVPEPFTVVRGVPSEFPHLRHPVVEYRLGMLITLGVFGPVLLWNVPLGDLRVAVRGAVVVLLLALAVGIGLTIASGPAVAVSPWGMWLRVRPGQAVFLPWAAVDAVYWCRPGHGNVLITVAGSSLGRPRLGALTWVVQHYRWLKHPRHSPALRVPSTLPSKLVSEMIAAYTTRPTA
jgi:hypothetical protein